MGHSVDIDVKYVSPLPPPGTSVPALYPTPSHCVGPSSYGRCLDILEGLLKSYPGNAHVRIYKLHLGWYLAVYDQEEWNRFAVQRGSEDAAEA